MRKRNVRNARTTRPAGPKTLAEYLARPESFRDRWNNVTHAISKMRADRISLRDASKEYGLMPQTVLRWGGSALRKRPNGEYAARSNDRLLRVLVIPTPNGLREVAVTDSRQASDLGKYWDAVQDYLETGDPSALRKLRRKQIIGADGEPVPLIKDVVELDRLGSAGVLSFESLYAQAA